MRKEWAEVYESLGKIHDLSLDNLSLDITQKDFVSIIRAIYNESSTIMEYMDKEPKFRNILSFCAKHNRATDESCCCPECEEEESL